MFPELDYEDFFTNIYPQISPWNILFMGGKINIYIKFSCGVFVFEVYIL